MMKFTRVGTGVAAATATLMCVLSSPVLAVTKVSGAVARRGLLRLREVSGQFTFAFLGLIALLLGGALLSSSVLCPAGQIVRRIQPGHGYD
jgi:hypothetical protein